MAADPSSLNKVEMANEIMASLRHHGVDVDYGSAGWQKLLEAISEGIIVHLQRHNEAFGIPVGGSGEHRHGHGSGHVSISVAGNTNSHTT